MNLWIGELACLVQFSHVLYSDFCADVLAWAGYREMVVVTRFGVKLKKPKRVKLDHKS